MSELQMDSKRSQSRGRSFPPALPHGTEPSILYQVSAAILSSNALEASALLRYSSNTRTVLTRPQRASRNSQYPPMLQTHCPSQAIPFKEQHFHRTPSESIGNNFTPRAQHMKIDQLQCSRQTPGPSSAIASCILSSWSPIKLCSV